MSEQLSGLTKVGLRHLPQFRPDLLNFAHGEYDGMNSMLLQARPTSIRQLHLLARPRDPTTRSCRRQLESSASAPCCMLICRKAMARVSCANRLDLIKRQA